MSARYAVRPRSVELSAARRQLSYFVIARGLEAKSVVGFDWRPATDAPTSFNALKESYAHSENTGEPLPVSNENLTSTIYLTEQADYALRFWHDVSHVRLGRSFAPVEELDLALWHLTIARTCDLSPLALKLLEADLVGQTLLYAAIKGYARDQMTFDLDVVMFGVADAIVMEKERQLPAAA